MKRGWAKMAVLAAALLAVSPGARADDPVPRIEMSTSATTVGKGEVFHLSVKVTTEDSSVESVTLPDLSAFEVLSQSVSNPVQVSFGFGSGGSGMTTTHTREYDIWLRSIKPGKVKLDAVTVQWKGKKYKGRPVTVTVTKQPPKQTAIPKSASPFPDMDWPFKIPGPQPSMPQPGVPVPTAPDQDASTDAPIEEVELTGAKFDPKMFIQTLVEPREVTIGQQVTLTLLLWSADDVVGNIEIPTEPGTDKFWVKDLQPPSAKVQFTPKTTNGQTFQVAVLRKLALFPTEAGEMTIAPAVVKTSTPFMGLLGGGSFTRTSVPVTVTVDPLPAAGRPDDFIPSSVGNFTLSATLAPTTTVVNQPVTYTLVLEGTGNLEMIAAPRLEFPEGVKTYDPQIDDMVRLREGVVGGTKKIEYLIMPEKPGKVSIGPIQWPFYDPEAGDYRILRVATKVLTVESTGTEGQEETTSEGDGIQNVDAEQQLRPIRTVAALHSPREQLVRTPWFLVAVILPPALMAIIYLVAMGRSLARGASRRNPAGRAFKDAVAVLRRAGEPGSENEFYAEIQRAIYLYLERRFDIPATGMTGPELMAALVRAGVDSPTAEKVVKETENCEFARYGRSSSERDMDMTRVRNSVQDVLQELEKVDVKPPKKGPEVRR